MRCAALRAPSPNSSTPAFPPEFYSRKRGPLTEIPFIKGFDFAYGEAAALTPLVRRVIARNPGPFTYTGTGTYIIGREGAHDAAVIDPGPDDAAHIEALLATIGAGRVSHVLVTHTHRDHCAGARVFADAAGAPIYAAGAHPARELKGPLTALDEGADQGFRPDHEIGEADVIEGDGWSIDVVPTPGHLSNHLCFTLREERTLFTGDHIMGWATTVVAPPDGDMGDYFASLDLLLERDDVRYLPTHGAPVDKPHRFVRAVRAHRRMRDGQILEQLKRGRMTIREIVPALYADIDKRLHGAAAMNVFAHLIRLVEAGAAETDGAPTLESVYRFVSRDAL